MTIEYAAKKPRDLSKVNANEIGEVLWWSDQLGNSPEALILLVNQFGSDINQIRSQMKKDV